MSNDLIDQPGEINEPDPSCSHCADSGIYENFVGEKSFCDCDAGCAAEANASIDLGFDDVDDFNCDDVDEGGLFEDDGDALASMGWGTDEDYGAY